MTTPNITDTVTPTPAAPVAPAAQTPVAPAAPVAPTRQSARAAIMAGVESAAAASAAASPTPAPAGAPAGTPGAPAAPVAAPVAPKPEDGIEIAPEAGASMEVGPVKLRFKNETTGQYTNTPPVPADHKIELEVGGKRYVKDLAGVVRLAADGIQNQRHASENSHIKTQVLPQYEQHISTIEQQLEAQIALNRAILSDEATWTARRQEFLDLNSPEQRAERAEQALAERERQETEGAQVRQHTEYYTANILPVLRDTLAEASTLSNEEILGRIALQTSDLLENGVVPPKHYPKFAIYLREHLAPWARAEHAKRNGADTARRETEQRADDERRRIAQLATRDVAPLAPASAPASGNVVASIQPGSQAPARSREEARQRIRQSIAASG